MTDIFVSYAREDRERVRPLVAVLEAQGWSVFWDFRIPPGETWESWIGRNLDQARCILVAWSENSVNSSFVREEAAEGRDRGVLIPLRLDPVKPPFGFRTIQSADLIDWDGSADAAPMAELLPHLARKVGDAPTVVRPAAISPAKPVLPPDSSDAGESGFRDRLRDGGQGPLMLWIPAGRFVMGSPETERGRYEAEGPVHTVSLRAFAIGCYPVTFEEYDLFAEATGRDRPDDKNWRRGIRPVINVSWEDATAYAQWLGEQTGKLYRLPSEAEWEYAARAGTSSRYWWGEDLQQGGRVWANGDGSGSEWSGRQTAPVGSFPPNGFGLHDTAGNVWEWVQDCWHENYSGVPADGSAWLETDGGDCARRVLRGGSWCDVPDWLRSAHRLWINRDIWLNNVGFRLAQDAD